MSAKLFGLVGGIAFLTLIILAPTSGPLLKKLGLVTPSETRKKVVAVLSKATKQYVLHEYIALLTEERFHDVDFTVVKDHIPILADINYKQVMAAVRHHKESSPEKTYKKPNLKNVIPYLYLPSDNTTNLKRSLRTKQKFSLKMKFQIILNLRLFTCMVVNSYRLCM